MPHGFRSAFCGLLSRHQVGDWKHWLCCTSGRPSDSYLCPLVSKNNRCCLSWSLMAGTNKAARKTKQLEDEEFHQQHKIKKGQMKVYLKKLNKKRNRQVKTIQKVNERSDHIFCFCSSFKEQTGSTEAQHSVHFWTDFSAPFISAS